MEKIIFNPQMITDNKEERTYSVRAVLFNGNNNLLIENNDNTYSLPGGQAQDSPSSKVLQKVLEQEYNINLTEEDLTPFLIMQSLNKKIKDESNYNNITYYYTGNINENNLNKNLEYKQLDDLENIILTEPLTDDYKELLSVIYLINDRKYLKARIRK